MFYTLSLFIEVYLPSQNSERSRISMCVRMSMLFLCQQLLDWVLDRWISPLSQFLMSRTHKH